MTAQKTASRPPRSVVQQPTLTSLRPMNVVQLPVSRLSLLAAKKHMKSLLTSRQGTIPRPPSPARRSALDGSKSRSERKQSTSRLTPKQKEAHRKRLYRGANISMQVVDILLKSRTGIVEFLHDKNLRLFRQTVRYIIQRNLQVQLFLVPLKSF